MKFATLLLTLCCLTPVCRASDLSERVLAELNFARTAPHEYARIILANAGAPSRDVLEAVHFLERSHPMPPLSSSQGLNGGAQLHVDDQGPRGACGHEGSGWGNSPWSRMSRFGQWIGSAAENVYYGANDARGIVCGLIVDRGVSSRGHRKNLFNPAFAVAGIACGPHTAYRSMCVIDFAAGYIEHGNAIAGL